MILDFYQEKTTKILIPQVQIQYKTLKILDYEIELRKYRNTFGGENSLQNSF